MMLKEAKSTDTLFVIGGFNAKIGKGTYQQNIGGNFGLGERNTRGDILIQFCLEHDLIIANTFFQHAKRILYGGRAREMFVIFVS